MAASRSNGASVLRDAATLYKVDADAIALKVKQEFATREKAKKASGTVAAKSPNKAKQPNPTKAA
jgi:ParB family chromosome partitioning protein